MSFVKVSEDGSGWMRNNHKTTRKTNLGNNELEGVRASKLEPWEGFGIKKFLVGYDPSGWGGVELSDINGVCSK